MSSRDAPGPSWTFVPTQGLFEAHLTVSDLAASIEFYRDRMGLELAYRHEGVGAAFFWVGDRGRSMLGLWEAGRGPNAMRLHVALACTLDDVLAAPGRLLDAGIAPKGFHGEPADEAVVIAWMPAAAVFLTDPDGHLLEYLAMLDGAPRPELGVVAYSAWSGKAGCPPRGGSRAGAAPA